MASLTAPFPAPTVDLPALSQLDAAWVFAVNYHHDDHDRNAGTAQWIAATLVLALWDYIDINVHLALASRAWCCMVRRITCLLTSAQLSPVAGGGSVCRSWICRCRCHHLAVRSGSRHTATDAASQDMSMNTGNTGPGNAGSATEQDV